MTNKTQELVPDARVVDALKGEISEPVLTTSHKPGSVGEQVHVRLAKEGPGLFGLTDWPDNKEWAGITNHVLLSARYAVHFAQSMAAIYEVDPQRILNGMIVSHAGRRQWDEAGWYPEAVKNAKARRSISNETLGMQLIEGKVAQNAFELVVALGHNVEGFSVDPSIYNSWDYRLAVYADHRTAQKYEPLNTRMGDFLLGNFFRREEVTAEVRDRVYSVIGSVIERRKNSHLELDEADQIASGLGISPDSERLSRKALMSLILKDADTEAALIQAGVNPDNINDETVPMPAWEDQFRRNYIKAAEKDIITRMSQLRGEEEIERDFPGNTWWGKYARAL